MTVAIETGLFEFVRDSSAIGAQIGDRFYPGVAPQGVTKPCATYSRISTAPDYTMGGSKKTLARFQIDCWAATYEAAKAAAEAIRTALEWKSGALGTATTDLIRIDNNRDEYDDNAKLYRDSTDYLIWY